MTFCLPDFLIYFKDQKVASHKKIAKSNLKSSGSQPQLARYTSSQPHAFKFFSRKSFEHLLFAMHPSTYQDIDRQLQALELRYPGTLASLCTIYDLNFSHPSSQGALIPTSEINSDRPAFDVKVHIDEDNVRLVRKCERATVALVVQPQEFGDHQVNSNHLVVGLNSKSISESFIVPLPLVLQANESRVLHPDTYQVYQHTLIRKPSLVAGLAAPMTQTFADYVDGAGLYVGITSRTWQERSVEHKHAALRGSMLLFHRALRNEFFDVYAHEHIVLRAGLTRSQALHIEEVEVEERTLHATHPDGLNMIPGGEAGLRFLSTMTKRPVNCIKVDEVDGMLELTVNKSLRQPCKGAKGAHTNARLAALWQKDMTFRIRAMTNQRCRLSYRQICNARIWQASGWSLEKIHAHLHGMDDREVSLDQVERLLDGRSYDTIPHVLIPLAQNIT